MVSTWSAARFAAALLLILMCVTTNAEATTVITRIARDGVTAIVTNPAVCTIAPCGDPQVAPQRHDDPGWQWCYKKNYVRHHVFGACP